MKSPYGLALPIINCQSFAFAKALKVHGCIKAKYSEEENSHRFYLESKKIQTT